MMRRDAGVAVIFDRLPFVEDRVSERVKDVIRKTAFDIEAYAKSVVPVDTGNLKNSINTTIEDGGLSATVGTHVEYAVYVEYGTHRMAARPYLRPAVERSRGPFLKALREIGR